MSRKSKKDDLVAEAVGLGLDVNVEHSIEEIEAQIAAAKAVSEQEPTEGGTVPTEEPSGDSPEEPPAETQESDNAEPPNEPIEESAPVNPDVTEAAAQDGEQPGEQPTSEPTAPVDPTTLRDKQYQ